MKKYFIAAAFLLLAGCASGADRAGGPPCPQAGILPGAAHLPIFTTEGPVKDEVRVMGKIGMFRGACRYRQPGQADFHLEINFLVNKTEKAGELKGLKLPYFIAILGPGETVLQKERFWTKIDFDNNNATTVVEEHDLQVPYEGSDAGGYKIAFGFELTKEQLDFNRGKIQLRSGE